MRARRALAISLCALSTQAVCAEIAADPPVGLAVTVYRDPERAQGAMDLRELRGFALVSETRMVRLPAGESRLRFEGVADGIEAQSAIISGLPDGVIEKNRDEKILSPEQLVSTAVGKSVELLRTDPKRGRTERQAGTILSDAGGGVVFQTADGIEALRCSGLPETFEFEPAGAPAARPSLSVLVRTPTAVTARVTLSYLSTGFDWSADYTANWSDDGRTIELGAWVTLANANGTSFPAANTQLIAGSVHREGEDDDDDSEPGGAILAKCWPRGSTSDVPPRLLRVLAKNTAMRSFAPAAAAAQALMEDVVTARKVQQEQLGDLKLYRVPERTTLASLQSKQVRLLDRFGIPVTTFYRADIQADADEDVFPAQRLLRTVNDKANQLGLALPSGNVAVYAPHAGERLLLYEAPLRDLAVNEKVEIGLGPSADVQVSITREKISIGPHVKLPPLLPGVRLSRAARDELEHVQVSNARAEPIRVEVRLSLEDGAQVVRADHALDSSSGRPTFMLSVPAQGSAAVRYQIRDQTMQVRK